MCAFLNYILGWGFDLGQTPPPQLIQEENSAFALLALSFWEVTVVTTRPGKEWTGLSSPCL